jgi:hypothetical protein
VTGQTVSWGSTGSGIFNSTSCALDGTCTVNYIPSDLGTGTHTITGNYVGDAAHLDSTGNFTLTVTAGTMTTTTTIVPTTPSGTATIWTDKPDYAPTDTPTIYGTGFLPNANITITVTRPEGTANTWYETSDGSGGFTTTYVTSGLVFGTFTVTATDGTNTATTTFTDASKISGKKTDVKDGSGLGGWTINLYKQGVIGVFDHKLTDSSGNKLGEYSFTGLAAGTYTVCEVLQSGWMESSPSSGGGCSGTNEASNGYSITVSGTMDVTGKDFANFKTFSISGTKSDVKDGSGLGGWTINLYKGGVFQSFATTVSSGTVGAYSFTGLGPGSYTVCEVLRSGWVESSPASGTTCSGTGEAQYGYSVTGASGTDVLGKDFSNQIQVVTVTLTVTSAPAGVGSVTFSISFTGGSCTPSGGSYGTDQSFTCAIGTSYTISNVQTIQSPDSSSRYKFVSATVNTGLLGTVPSGGQTVTLNYQLQYLVSFTQAGSAVAPAVKYTVGAGSEVSSTVPFTVWVDSVSPVLSISYSYEGVVSGAAGVQYVLTATAPTSPQDVSGALTIAGTYKTQWLQTFAQSGLSSDASGLVVTVNGVTTSVPPFSSLPYSVYVDQTSLVTYSYASTVGSSVTGKQYVLTTPASSPASPYTVDGTTNAAVMVTGTYQTQYFLTVTSTHDSATGQGWYDANAPVSSSVTSPADDDGHGTRYRATGWTGTGSAPSSGTATTTGSFNINAPSGVTWNWMAQYRVTFGQTGLDNTAQGTVVTVNTIQTVFNNMPYSDWFDAVSSVTYQYTSPVPSSIPNKQFWLSSTTCSSVTCPTSPFNVNGPLTITGNYLVLPISSVTTSSLCRLANDQFKLLFLQDMQNPNTYKLTASNPGQFYYNVFYVGTLGETASLSISIPAPFVTQGAMPVHVYSSVSYSGGCFVPSGELAAYAKTITGLGGGTISLTNIKIPSSGLVYVTVHLDFGYKITPGFTPDGGLNAYLNAKKIIPNNNPYMFSYANGVTHSATVSNVNDFKKIAGFGGIVTDSPGVKVTVKVGGNTYTTTTNDDGFYLIPYKTGKTQSYTITVTGFDPQSGTINANKFVVNNFP